MAGIAGILGVEPQDETVRRMLQAIKHRGPDTVRLHAEGGLRAGVRASRLSEARGDGFAEDGGTFVFFDGEIYNERAEGISDAAVVLDLHRKYGRLFAAHLEGVFACAVLDGRELIFARDAVGVRPLYFGTTEGGDLAFASEAKSLVGVCEDVRELLPATTFSSRSGLAG